MITKWFIGVSAKSKGFFNGWQYQYGYKKNILEALPSFTKQAALATSYNTQEEAKEAVENYITKSSNEYTKYKKKLDVILKVKPQWPTLDLEQREKFISDYGLYRILSDRNRWSVFKQRSPEEREEDSKNIAWDKTIQEVKNQITLHKNRVEFLKTKIVIREQDLELKFMDRERRKIEWQQRDENDTASAYCNLCGGAVPSIPQLVIYGMKETTIICAICMGRLAQEAEIQAGKVSDEIMEQYQTDRFLRGLG